MSSTGQTQQYQPLTATSAPPPPRDTVQTALGLQDEYLVDLHQAINTLESVLALVLTPTNATVGQGGGAPSTAPVSIYDRTRTNALVISAAISRLNGIGSRLQL